MFLWLCSVKLMVETGKEILQKNNITDLDDVRWASCCSSWLLVWFIFSFILVHVFLFKKHPLMILQAWFSLAPLLFCHTPTPSCPGTRQSNGLHVPALLQTQLLLVYHSKSRTSVQKIINDKMFLLQLIRVFLFLSAI